MTNLRAVATSFSSIHAQWDLPLHPNGEITSYDIYYRTLDITQVQPTTDPLNDNSYSVIPVIPSDGGGTPPTSVNITGLKAFTYYVIKVHAIGWGQGGTGRLIGDIDMEIILRTNSAVPSEPPTITTDSATQSPTTGTIFIHLPPPEQLETGQPM